MFGSSAGCVTPCSAMQFVNSSGIGRGEVTVGATLVSVASVSVAVAVDEDVLGPDETAEPDSPGLPDEHATASIADAIIIAGVTALVPLLHMNSLSQVWFSCEPFLS